MSSIETRETNRKQNRKPNQKFLGEPIWVGSEWRVVEGKLKPGRGRPAKVTHLFKIVAEKLPFECLSALRDEIGKTERTIAGVYLCHDSMGVARYGGRDQIFNRLAVHKKKYPLQIMYFSFYVIASKNHEREIETAILRAAGAQMTLNTRKIGNGIEPGDIRDYGPGTEFFERQCVNG